MLVCSNRVRLSDRDKRLLVWASQGLSADHIRTVEQLAEFIHAAQRLYSGNSAEERRIRVLLERFIPDEAMIQVEGNVLRLLHI